MNFCAKIGRNSKRRHILSFHAKNLLPFSKVEFFGQKKECVCACNTLLINLKLCPKFNFQKNRQYWQIEFSYQKRFLLEFSRQKLSKFNKFFFVMLAKLKLSFLALNWWLIVMMKHCFLSEFEFSRQKLSKIQRFSIFLDFQLTQNFDFWRENSNYSSKLGILKIQIHNFVTF